MTDRSTVCEQMVDAREILPAREARFRFARGRPPAIASEAMIATSQPSATRAGLGIMEKGGNAADAVIAAAAVLGIAEPMETGIGGDAFAMVTLDGRVEGLDSAGPAPADADPATPIAEHGPTAVTVPGAVAGWAALSERYGRLGLDRCLAPGIDAAENGITVGAVSAQGWNVSGPFVELASAPRAGDRFRLPNLAKTLRRVAEDGPAGFYQGEVSDAIVAASWLSAEDLARYRPLWVDPLSISYRGARVYELPPPTQGVAALEGLGLLELGKPTLSEQVECVHLALEDALLNVRDGADVSGLIDAAYLRNRRTHALGRIGSIGGGTVYLCAVDGDGLAVSFIQSLYGAFGARVIAPGTGVVLQNRGACFAVSGAIEAGRRPYHTLMPGMLERDGKILGPFGIMGGFMQAQAHVQFVSALIDDGVDPQAALDRPRFRVESGVVHLEEGLWDRAEELAARGHSVARHKPPSPGDDFGGGQAVLRTGDALMGGSDPRKDGYAAGY